MGPGASGRAAEAGLAVVEVLGCGAVAVVGLAARGALPTLGGESALALVFPAEDDGPGPAEADESHVDDSFKPPSGVVA